jgi:hypothetical protein
MAQIVFRNIDTLELGDLIGYAKTDTVNKEVFTNELENFKSHLRDALAVKTNHSKKTEANEIMEYLNSIDVESLTYPTVHLPQKMRDDNKFMALNAF